ncbi:hypothetical protein [Prosthecobacter sp.]|uniref:hypothetical protein n=1 Tax=Prosthecobacter sp. TaxID=1965333 RepID=UPI003783589F
MNELVPFANRMLEKNGGVLPGEEHALPSDLHDFRAARDYAKYDVIYIEDIGSGATLDKGAGAVTCSRIAELLQLRSGQWTLLDANLYRREIETQIDGRIASRLKRDGSWMRICTGGRSSSRLMGGLRRG